MGLLSAWFETHKKYFEGRSASQFIKEWVPEEYLGPISKNKGSVRYAKQIIDQDCLGASDRETPAKAGIELQKNLQDNEIYQIHFREKLKRYDRKNLLKDGILEEFWTGLENALVNNKKTYRKKEHILNCNHLINRIHNIKITKDSSADLLYAYLYFALFKFLPEEFAYNDYNKYEEDFDEFRKKIVDSLGIYSFTGMAILYALAERGMDKRKTQKTADLSPNIFALFTKGQLEYYGRGPSGKRDIPEAYKCYKKVRELNPYHPMAIWAITDLKLSYERGEIDSVIEDFENEKIHIESSVFVDEQIRENECKDYYPEKWYIEIRDDLKMAACYGSAPAENLLGRIIQGEDKYGRTIFPKKYLGDLQFHDAEEHYQKSADRGYVFAYINLYECQKLKAESKDKSDRRDLCKSAFENLMKAADWGLPYAANKISQYFLGNGKDVVADFVKIDEEKAFLYAKKALAYARMTHSGYWPFYNIVEFFYYNEKSKYYKKIEVREMKKYLKLAKDNIKEDSKDGEKFREKVEELERKINQEN